MDSFLRPLIEETAARRATGIGNLFNSHMYGGSELPLEQNIAESVELLTLCAENDIILEVEAGVVGGEEDGIDHSGVADEKLYTTPGDTVRVYEALNGRGRFMVRCHLWQGSRSLQARCCQAATGDSERRTESCHRQAWRCCRIRPRIPWRLRNFQSAAAGDPGLWGRQNEYRHRYAVRVYSLNCGLHPEALRSGADDRW